MALVTLTLLCLFSYLIFVTSRWLLARHTKRARGCRDPLMYPHLDRFWGSDLLKARTAALKEGRLNQLYLAHHRKHGRTWAEISNGTVAINTIEPTNVRYILAENAANFTKKAATRNRALRRLFGTGIIWSDGDDWRRSRSLVKPTFSRFEVSNMPLVKGHVDRFMDLLPVDGRTFDIQPMLKMLFLDVATEFLLGQSFDAQLPEKTAEANDILQTFDEALLGMNKRRQGFSLTTLRLFFDKSWPRAVKKLHAFIDRRVQTALQNTRSATARESEGSSSDDKLDRVEADEGRYILVKELAKQIRDPLRLRSEIFNVLLPARDNTAILISNALFQLARHPEEWGKLRAIALSLGTEPTFSFELLKSLHRFHWVLNEAFRTCGPGGRILRVAAQNDVLPMGGGEDGKSPVFVPRDTIIIMHLPSMHKDLAFWGSDADHFRPDRWDGLLTYWEFIPFLGGPRICPAQNQVYVQATYVLVNLARRFGRIENRDEVHDFVEISRLTTESRRGVKVALIA